MPPDYSGMDNWSDDEVARFKDAFEQPDQPALGFGGQPSGRIIAEGDSWFDYVPGTDLIDCLRNHHRYQIKNFGRAGDTLENMIYGTGIDSRFRRTSPTIRRVLSWIRQHEPHAFLFSGGGNDIAGDEFGSFLNHIESGRPTLRMEYVTDMIEGNFRKCISDLVEKVSDACPETRIIMHGYGHTLATGKGVSWLFFDFAGPWLRPALASKGITDEAKGNEAVRVMINTFNDMLASLDDEHGSFKYVDLRPIIDETNDWANELHLRNSAYARAADLIHSAIQD